QRELRHVAAEDLLQPPAVLLLQAPGADLLLIKFMNGHVALAKARLQGNRSRATGDITVLPPGEQPASSTPGGGVRPAGTPRICALSRSAPSVLEGDPDVVLLPAADQAGPVLDCDHGIPRPLEPPGRDSGRLPGGLALLPHLVKDGP